jgi:hypothetical protein
VSFGFEVRLEIDIDAVANFETTTLACRPNAAIASYQIRLAEAMVPPLSSKESGP